MATSYIRASGATSPEPTYTTLTAWEAAKQGTLSEIEIAECYDDWATGLNEKVVIDGSTTSSSNYMKIVAASGHEHGGIPEAGFFLKYTTQYNGAAVVIGDNYVRLENIEIQIGNNGSAIFTSDGTLRFVNVLAKSGNDRAFEIYGGTVINCLAYGGSHGFYHMQYTGAQTYLYNCIAANCTTGFWTADTDITLKNCVAYNNTTNYSGTFNSNSTNNATSTGSDDAPGANSVYGLTSADFVDSANNDFHIDADSDLYEAGVDLSGTFTTDIDGDTWASTWSIGFDQPSAGGGAITGTAAITFGAGSTTITGKGALAGSAALAFGASSTATGKGAVAGSATLTFAAAGTVAGNGAIAGSAALTFAATGTATGKGALAATSALTFDAEGTLLNAAAGSVAGTSAITFASTGTLTGKGSLAATGAMAFAGSGAATGKGALTGQADVLFTLAGALDGLAEGAIAGSSAITFSPTGTLTAKGTLAGQCDIVFGGSAYVEAPEEEAQATGGWVPRWEPPNPPSSEEVRRRREELGILPPRVRRAVEAVAERELASAVDEGGLRQAYAEIESGELQRRVERQYRAEGGGRRGRIPAAVPAILRTIIEDGLARIARQKMQADSIAIAAQAEERDINEILALWIRM